MNFITDRFVELDHQAYRVAHAITGIPIIVADGKGRDQFVRRRFLGYIAAYDLGTVQGDDLKRYAHHLSMLRGEVCLLLHRQGKADAYLGQGAAIAHFDLVQDLCLTARYGGQVHGNHTRQPKHATCTCVRGTHQQHALEPSIGRAMVSSAVCFYGCEGVVGVLMTTAGTILELAYRIEDGGRRLGFLVGILLVSSCPQVASMTASAIRFIGVGPDYHLVLLSMAVDALR